MQRSSVLWFFASVGALMVLGAVGGAVGCGVVPLWRARASLEWPETRCHIQRSEVEGGRETYRTIIEYTYEVGGERRSGDRIDFALHGSSNWRSSHEKQVRRYPVDSDVPCWYERDDPANVVLSREVPATFWLLFPVVFAVVGFVFLKEGARRLQDDVPGTPDGDGHTYSRRCTTWGAVSAGIAMWLVTIAAAILADTVSDRLGKFAIFAGAAVATLVLLHELRCLVSSVTLTAPVELRPGDNARVAWRARSLLGSPPATASFIAVATTSTQVVTSRKISDETTVETVLTIAIEHDVDRAGAGTLVVPTDVPTSSPGREIDHFVEVHVHLPFGPDVRVRAPIHLTSQDSRSGSG